MALSPTALYSAFADDLSHAGYTDEAFLSRCFAALVGSTGFPSSEKARAFIERECTIAYDDVDATSAAIRLQLKAMYWKYLHTTSTSPDLDAVALDKFMSVNKRLELWHYSPNTSGDEELMGSFKELIWHFWNPQGFPLVSNLHILLDRGSTGPGVSVGARGEDFYTKMFSSPLTYTSEVLRQVYLAWTDEEPTWSQAESNRSATYGDPLAVHGSSLKFVPKDVRESRTIAVEPSLNMYYQLGLGSILTDRIRSFFGVDLRSQQLWNREAARVGSLPEQVIGSNPEPKWAPGFATIDLKSASDSMGLRLLEWALPPDFYRLLCRLRSRTATLADGSSVELNMVSTMGNGFTFPLQTMLFSCVVVAAIKSYGLTPMRPYVQIGPSCSETVKVGFRSDLAHFRLDTPMPGILGSIPRGLPEEWGVFGDDIICHPEVAFRVLRLLDLLGFEVNATKSFIQGRFRESCGSDFFMGRDIRAFYVKEALNNRTSLYKALNGFLEWSTRTGILIPNLGRLLLSDLKQYESGDFPLLVPLGEGRDSGLRIPLKCLRELMRKHDVGVRLDEWSQSLFYNRLVPHAKQLRIGDGFIAVPRKLRRRKYNPAGLLLAFIRGDVRTGRISVRQNDTRYRKRGCICPNWDYIPPKHDWVRSVGFRVDMKRLETASRSLLGLNT
jgi:hypothetical protein